MSTIEITNNDVGSQSGSEEKVEVVVNSHEDPAFVKSRHLMLYRAALDDDWNMAEEILKDHQDDIKAKISKKQNTLLHIAVAANSPVFVEKLLHKMDRDDMAAKNIDENTAFCLAAASGNVKFAKQMMEKCDSLAKTKGVDQKLPLHMAAVFGHEEMVKYLYEATGDIPNAMDRIKLLVALVKTGLYDVALDLAKKYPELATARDEKMETALHALARTPMMSSNFNYEDQQGILKGCFNQCSETKMLRKKKLPPVAHELIKHLWKQVIVLDDSKISEIIGAPWRLIFGAAKQGNVEFLTILIREYPDLAFKVDENNYTIFHYAVLFRHNDIFKLIYGVGSFKDLIVPYKDPKEMNNMLHLAGLLAPPNRLNNVSGAALQLQRELLWFKEVSKIVHPLDVEAKNKEGMTPRDLFTEKHKKLKEEGEKWMKDTADYCMIVATLIATVVFAAAFTVPGSTKEEGIPNFLQKASFKVFVISDAISLVSSSCAIINFLSILTSRYAEEDFLLVLPRKLVAGLATLFLSIAAMMVVFSSTIFILFKDEVVWVPILVSVAASLPIILFTRQQLRLFFDVIRSTFNSSSLFQPSKGPTLFCKN